MNILIDSRYKVSAPYKYMGEHNSDLVEYNVTFNKSPTAVEKFCEFLEYEEADTQNKRVNICYSDGFDPKAHKMFSKFHDNLHVRLTQKDYANVPALRESGVKFFYPETLPANNLVALEAMISEGVTSVYIADDLCYSMDAVSAKCEASQVQLRCVLNRVPMTVHRSSADVRTMVYHPKDIDMLVQWFDVFEFDCGTTMNYDWHLFNVLVRSWFVKEAWSGNVQEINKDLGFELYEKTLLNGYSKNKYNCGRACALRDNMCNRCQNYYDVSDKLHKRQINVRQQKGR